MFRFSINIESSRKSYLEHIRKNMLYPVNNAGGTQKLLSGDGRSYLEISVENEYKDRIEYALKNLIAEVISMGFKTDYLKSRLRFGEETLLDRTLVNTMSVFDNSIDRKLAFSGLEEVNKLSLDGFFTFRMQRLRERWDEIVTVTGTNSVIYYSEEVKREFLQYLVASLPTLSRNVTLDTAIFGSTLYDGMGKEIERLSLLKSGDFSEEEEILFNLVNISPKTLMLTGDTELLSEEFLSLVKELFTVVSASETKS